MNHRLTVGVYVRPTSSHDSNESTDGVTMGHVMFVAVPGAHLIEKAVI
jgi:hypothetical protein